MAKLIRDKYKNTIEEDRLAYTHNEDQRKRLLQDKLIEEIHELADSDFKDVAEYGDVIEVLYALASANYINISDIEHARHLKLEEYGGFEEGLILETKDQ